MTLRVATIAAVVGLGATLSAQTPKKAVPSSPMVARVGDTGFIQLRADGFTALSPREQALAYWLSQASITRPLITFQS